MLCMLKATIAVILCHLHSTELAIHEFALSQEQLPLGQPALFNRVDSLYACLMAITSYFGVFFTFASRQYLGFSNLNFFQATHVFYCLYQLTAVEDPVWDRQAVLSVANLSFVGRRLSMHLRSLTSECGLVVDGPEDLFSRLASRVDSATRNWEANLRSKGVDLGIEETDHNTGENMPDDTFEMPLDLGTEEFWLTDLLAPLEW